MSVARSVISLLAASALLSLSTGCYDFAGEKGVLGFVSSHTLDGRQPWTAAYAVVPGEMTVRASEVLATGAESPQVEVSATKAKLLPADAGEAKFVAGAREQVLEFSGAASDRVTVVGKRPDQACLSPLVAALVGDAGCLGPVGLAGPSRFGVTVRDRKGLALGYVAERLGAEGASLAHDQDGFLLTPGAEGRVRLVYGGVDLGGPTVQVVSPTEVVRLEVVEEAKAEEGRALRAIGRTAGGLPVYGLEVRWQADGEQHPLGPDALLTADPEVSVSYGALSASG